MKQKIKEKIQTYDINTFSFITIVLLIIIMFSLDTIFTYGMYDLYIISFNKIPFELFMIIQMVYVFIVLLNISIIKKIKIIVSKTKK